MPILSNPEGATIYIDGKEIGIAPVSFRVEGSFDYFVATCLNAGRVSCDKKTMFGFLKTKDVARWWWDFTDEQRKTLAVWIIDEFAADTINYIRSGKPDCKGGEGEWKEAICLHNTMHRYVRLGDPAHLTNYLDYCYWSQDKQVEYCFLESPLTIPPYGIFKGCYGLPVHPAAVRGKHWGHSIVALQIKRDIKNFNSWRFFQYDDFQIKPGNWQMPCGVAAYDTMVKVERITAIDECGCGYYHTVIAKWRIDTKCKVV